MPLPHGPTKLLGAGRIRIKPVRYRSGYLDITLDFSGLPKELGQRFGVGSKFQAAVDTHVLREVSKYVPQDTNALIASAQSNTKRGSGILEWGGTAPALAPGRARPGLYAVRQYFENPGPGGMRGLRGKLWIKRFANDGAGGFKGFVKREALKH